VLVIKGVSAPADISLVSDVTSRQHQPDNVLRLNQVLTARVSRQISNGVELEVGSQRFQAKTDLQLNANQQLVLQVVALGRQVELKLLKTPETFERGLLPLLKPWRLAEGLQRMGQQSLEDPALSRAVAALLSRLGASPGGLTGTDIRDWTALAGRLFQPALEDDQSGKKATTLESPRSVKTGTDHLAQPEAEQHDELTQLLSALRNCRDRLAHHGQLFVPLPADYAEQGYLLFHGGRTRSEESSSSPILSLHLKMESLGALRIDIVPSVSGLNLKFVCDAPETAELLQGHVGLLRESPTAEVYRELHFTTGAEPPATSLIRAALPPGQGLLRVRI
jgi:hypothetical protein